MRRDLHRVRRRLRGHAGRAGRLISGDRTGRGTGAGRRPSPVAAIAALSAFGACAPLAAPGSLPAQAAPAERLEEVARELIQAARYAVLITLDESGHPRARVMDPLPPDSAMTVWLATNPRSRKVQQIRADPRVTLHYFDPATPGYVSMMGTARLVDDDSAKADRWKAEWDGFFPDRADAVLLIEVKPARMEVVSAAHGLPGDPVTWTPGGVTLPDP